MQTDNWHHFLEHLNQVGKTGLMSFLKNTQTHFLDDNIIEIACKNEGHRYYIDGFKSEIETELEVLFSTKYTVKTTAVLPAPKQNAVTLPIIDFSNRISHSAQNAGVREGLTFENYAIASKNEFCVAAAKAVVGGLGKSYNPLFIWGDVGVGKTHLLMAIANEVLKNDPQKRVLYASCESLVTDLVASIRSNKQVELRSKYRNLDLLMIDDIQFIAGKESSENELFNIFNTIIDKGGQIVFTSDTPPDRLKNIDNRLLSRFSSGLVCEVQSPDFELRCAILIIKSREEDFDLSYEVLEHLATKHNNIRIMLGELKNLKARSMLMGENISLETITTPSNEKSYENTNRFQRPIPVKEIVRSVCNYYDVSASEVKGSSRSARIVLARQLIMYLLRHKANKTLMEIAHLLEKKDHTTIIHGINKITRDKINNPSFASIVDKITQNLQG